MKPDTGLMVWTLIIFAVLMFVLSRYAFGPLTRAVEARERSLQEAIDAAKADRDAAAKLLQEHQAQIEAARDDAQKYIAEGRAVAEKMRADMIEQTRKEQQDMLERARRDIESDKVKAISQLRREAVDLALAGASKVIEQNLESQKNRQLVESYLSSIGTLKVGQ
jgi:F-type H+-transporting ATPase subunit b